MFAFKKEKRNFSNEYLLGQIDERMNKLGCPICHLTDKSVYDYIDSLFYENVNDPVERADFMKGHGYCSKHLKMIETHLSTHPQLGTLGVNILYHDLLDYLEGAFEEEIKTGDGCKLCKVEKSAQRRYLELFTEYISTPARADKYANSISMVCLKHTKMLRNLKGFDPTKFLRIQKEKLHKLRHYIDEFIRKSDYRYSDEPITVEEGQAWRMLSKFLE